VLFSLDLEGKSLAPLEPLALSALGKREKDLEELLAKHLFGVLFEVSPFLVFHQERRGQAVADIYAIDATGGLVLFELKREAADSGAFGQLLRYTQEASRWSFDDLDAMFREYPERSSPTASLAEAHRDAFGLSEPLKPEEFNRRQRMVAVGSAADVRLVEAVEYWRQRGVDVDFIPYRIFEVGREKRLYFEFFAKPFDQRVLGRKGVLFDTNASFDEDSVWDMFSKRKIAAWGSSKEQVRRLTKGDTVFYVQKNVGVVAAAEVTGSRVLEVAEDDELYLPVRFLTTLPNRDSGFRRAVPASEVRRVTGKSFYWARTVKVPYLWGDEAKRLLAHVQKVLRKA